MEDTITQENIKFPEMAEEILGMAEVDQEMRRRVNANQGIIESEEDDNLDKKHTERMKEIIKQIGWPTISKVGAKASDKAWLLVQHADHDVEFQKSCLSMMKQEIQGEVLPKNIAYLEDRVRINSNQPQLYGTQFRWKDNKPLQNIEDRENVDERRKEMGLKTLAEGIEEMYRAYNIEKPK